MKVDLLKVDLESLDLLKPTPGYRVLQVIGEEVNKDIMKRSFSVKSRTIVNGNISITETADTQLARLAGIKEGVEFVLNQIEHAHEKLSN